MEGYIDIKRLTLDELIGVVNLYPWFGGARKELCGRMVRMGADSGDDAQYASAALHLPSRRVIADLLRKAGEKDLSDADVKEAMRSYVEEHAGANVSKKKVYVGVGDYFSQEEYDQVRNSADNVFSRESLRNISSRPVEETGDQSFDLFTETLAQIYAEQGYYEQAKDIYSKLILAYPEKNAYFAALIQKIDELN